MFDMSEFEAVKRKKIIWRSGENVKSFCASFAAQIASNLRYKRDCSADWLARSFSPSGQSVLPLFAKRLICGLVCFFIMHIITAADCPLR